MQPPSKPLGIDGLRKAAQLQRRHPSKLSLPTPFQLLRLLWHLARWFLQWIMSWIPTLSQMGSFITSLLPRKRLFCAIDAEGPEAEPLIANEAQASHNDVIGAHIEDGLKTQGYAGGAAGKPAASPAAAASPCDGASEGKDLATIHYTALSGNAGQGRGHVAIGIAADAVTATADPTAAAAEPGDTPAIPAPTSQCCEPVSEPVSELRSVPQKDLRQSAHPLAQSPGCLTEMMHPAGPSAMVAEKRGALKDSGDGLRDGVTRLVTEIRPAFQPDYAASGRASGTHIMPHRDSLMSRTHTGLVPDKLQHAEAERGITHIPATSLAGQQQARDSNQQPLAAQGHVSRADAARQHSLASYGNPQHAETLMQHAAATAQVTYAAQQATHTAAHADSTAAKQVSSLASDTTREQEGKPGMHGNTGPDKVPVTFWWGGAMGSSPCNKPSGCSGQLQLLVCFQAAPGQVPMGAGGVNLQSICSGSSSTTQLSRQGGSDVFKGRLSLLRPVGQPAKMYFRIGVTKGRKELTTLLCSTVDQEQYKKAPHNFITIMPQGPQVASQHTLRLSGFSFRAGRHASPYSQYSLPPIAASPQHSIHHSTAQHAPHVYTQHMSVPQVSASACTSMAARALYMLMQTGHGRCGTAASVAVAPRNSHSQGSAEAPGFAIEEVLLDGAQDWHWAQRVMAQESGGMEHLTVPQALQALGHRLISCCSWTAAAMATTHGPARHQAKPDARSTHAQQGCSTRGSSPNKEGGHAQQQEPQQASPVQVLVERPELAMLGFATEGFLQVVEALVSAAAPAPSTTNTTASSSKARQHKSRKVTNPPMQPAASKPSAALFTHQAQTVALFYGPWLGYDHVHSSVQYNTHSSRSYAGNWTAPANNTFYTPGAAGGNGNEFVLQLFDSHAYDYGDGLGAGASLLGFVSQGQLAEFLAQRFPQAAEVFDEMLVVYELSFVELADRCSSLVDNTAQASATVHGLPAPTAHGPAGAAAEEQAAAPTLPLATHDMQMQMQMQMHDHAPAGVQSTREPSESAPPAMRTRGAEGMTAQAAGINASGAVSSGLAQPSCTVPPACVQTSTLPVAAATLTRAAPAVVKDTIHHARPRSYAAVAAAAAGPAAATAAPYDPTLTAAACAAPAPGPSSSTSSKPCQIPSATSYACTANAAAATASACPDASTHPSQPEAQQCIGISAMHAGYASVPVKMAHAAAPQGPVSHVAAALLGTCCSAPFEQRGMAPPTCTAAGVSTLNPGASLATSMHPLQQDLHAAATIDNENASTHATGIVQAGTVLEAGLKAAAELHAASPGVIPGAACMTVSNSLVKMPGAWPSKHALPVCTGLEDDHMDIDEVDGSTGFRACSSATGAVGAGAAGMSINSIPATVESMQMDSTSGAGEIPADGQDNDMEEDINCC